MRPTPRFLLLLGFGLLPALAPALLNPALWVLWPGWVALSLAVLCLDAALGVRARGLARGLVVPKAMAVGTEATAHLTLELRGRFPPAALRARIDVEGDLVAPGAHDVAIQGGIGEVRLPLFATRRGTGRVRALWLSWEGPMGLVRRTLREPRSDEVAIVPAIGRVRQQALAMPLTRHLIQGLRTVRWAGEGSAFEAMREHVRGMDVRSVSWRASARHRRLISHEYRAERNHQVMVVLDTGRLMSEPIHGIPKLDHAVESALVLAQAALRTGDRVGLHAFGDVVRTHVAPRAGMQHWPRLQAAATGLDYGAGETNFTLGLTDLSVRLRRRSLVILLTDFIDTVTTELMIEHTGGLARRHLVIFVALRDPALTEMADEPPASMVALHRAVVASDLVAERELVLRRLRRAGILCVDATPAEATPQLLERYLHVRQREMI